MQTVFAKSCEDMSEIPDASVQSCVTSPPYYGLRDYEHAGQIGAEATVAEYVERLVGVFREVRRTLREDGTLWLNLGDSYAGSWGAQGRTGEMSDRSVISARQIAAHPHNRLTGKIRGAGLKPKDLIGVPWRVAFALQADGWWLRSDIIWHKPNPMPSSVADRCTSSHEHIFMLAKSERYFFDADAIREPLAEATIGRIAQAKWRSGEQAGSVRANGGAKTNGPMRAVVNAKGLTQPPQIEDGNYSDVGANTRDVWTIATTPYSEAHFATFPLELPTLCIRAGTSEAGCCSACGASRIRCVEVGDTIITGGKHRPAPPAAHGIKHHTGNMATGEVRGRERTTTGFEPSCKCDAPTVGSLVCDPFMGSGTTAQAAESLGRRWVGYELNPAYHALIAERTRQKGLFTA